MGHNRKTANRGEMIIKLGMKVDDQRKRVNGLAGDLREAHRLNVDVKRKNEEDHLAIERRLLGEIERLQSNEVLLGVEIETLKRPWRLKAVDWFRRKLGRPIPDPPALALWVSSFQRDVEDRPIYAVRAELGEAPAPAREDTEATVDADMKAAAKAIAECHPTAEEAADNLASVTKMIDSHVEDEPLTVEPIEQTEADKQIAEIMEYQKSVIDDTYGAKKEAAKESARERMKADAEDELATLMQAHRAELETARELMSKLDGGGEEAVAALDDSLERIDTYTQEIQSARIKAAGFTSQSEKAQIESMAVRSATE